MQGTYTAIITPFMEDGSLDIPTFSSLVQRQKKAGVEGIVLLGTTGESPTVTKEERVQLISVAKELCSPSMQLIVGTGTNSTASTVMLTKQAKDLGADAALVVVPYYNKPTDEGSMAHFRACREADLPIILYHHPGRTGTTLKLETIITLAEEKTIIGIKETITSEDYLTQLREAVSISLFSGDDMTTGSFMRAGGDGIISVCSNLIPKETKEMIDAYLQDLPERGDAFFTTYSSLLEVIGYHNPIGIKTAMSELYLCKSHMRLPLMQPSFEIREKIAHEVDKLKTIEEVSQAH
jgi:4-hydroxy-tetrahydrodipicolinate synthase